MTARGTRRVGSIAPTRPASGAQERAERTRVLIMEETVRCVVEEGFAAATAKHIAERAGVTWGVIQYHFGDRDGLLTAVVDASFDELRRRMAAVGVGAGSAREQVSALVEAAWAAFCTPASRASLEIAVATRSHRDAATGEHFALVAAELARLGEELIAERPHHGDARAVGHLLWAALRGLVFVQLATREPLDTSRERAALVDLLVAHLEPAGAARADAHLTGDALMTQGRLRVVQWTTGNVGRRALRAIAADPRLELVGCFAHSPDKVGVDAGVLAGGEPVGVLATDDIDALLATHPDCVSYSPMHFDDDQVSRLLTAGVNVSTTAEFITGDYLGAQRRAALERAALDGGATLFGSGINPGFANLFGLVSAGICQRVDRIRVTESVDASGYESAETQGSIGFGLPIDTPDLLARARRATAVFADAVALMADALGAELDDIVFDARFAVATDDADLGFMAIPKGTVSGVRAAWTGTRGGKPFIECRVLWVMGPHREPPWKVGHGYFVEIDGLPAVRSQLQILPPPDWSEPNYMGLGMIMTAMPAVNAIPAVCAAPPGIATVATLPLVTAVATSL